MNINTISHGTLRTTLIAATVAAMLSLSACGGSGTISKGLDGSGSGSGGGNAISTTGGSGSGGTSGAGGSGSGGSGSSGSTGGLSGGGGS
ncbi:hypothetical protein ISG10_17480, partial [Burkholderia pseudomallei]|nr:hypothetical protein [Burkholderia pseudomallei]MBF3601658.1 hypothetical protein [Burkholderia pseudomallei]